LPDHVRTTHSLPARKSSPKPDFQPASRAVVRAAPVHRPLDTAPAQREDRTVHIFIDFSNLYLGIRPAEDRAKLSVKRLAQRIEQQRFCAEKWVAGSGTQGGVQKQFSDAGYTLKWDPRSGPEHNIDEALHAQLLNAVSKEYRDPRAHTAVLVTGDGNRNGGASTFVECVERALQKGWRVEVWSWSASVNPTYGRFAELYQQQFVLNMLDEYRWDFVADEVQHLCVVCIDNPRNGLCLPCAHLCVCTACAVDIQRGINLCPLCRQPLESVRNVFL